MAKGEIEVLILGDVNPVYTMPPKSGFVEALAKVPMVVSLATRPSETTVQGPRRAARAALARVVGRPRRRARRRAGSCSRRWGRWRSMASRWTAGSIGDILLVPRPSGAGARRRGRQGRRLPCAELRGRLREGRVEGRSPGRRRGQAVPRVLGGVAAAGRLLARGVRPRRPRCARRPARPAAAARPRGRRHPRAARRTRPRGSTTGAAPIAPWLQEAPDTMTQVAWDAWVEIPTETAKRLGVTRGDLVTPHVAARTRGAARLSGGDASSGRGGGGHGTGARVPRRLRAGARDLNATGANPVTLLGASPEAGLGRAAVSCGQGGRGQAGRAAARSPSRSRRSTRTTARSPSTSGSARPASSSCAASRPSTPAIPPCTRR